MTELIIVNRKDTNEMNERELLVETVEILRRFEDALTNLSNSPMFRTFMG